MSAPQEPMRRKKQKARRTKQLADWRAKQVKEAEKKPAAATKK